MKYVEEDDMEEDYGKGEADDNIWKPQQKFLLPSKICYFVEQIKLLLSLISTARRAK